VLIYTAAGEIAPCSCWTLWKKEARIWTGDVISLFYMPSEFSSRAGEILVVSDSRFGSGDRIRAAGLHPQESDSLLFGEWKHAKFVHRC
jgi:hypothetical protein